MTAERRTGRPALGQYAGFTSRLVAYVVDRLILAAALAIYGTVVGFASTNLGPQLTSLSEALSRAVAVILLAIAPTIVIAYYTIFWMSAGQTPGKQLVGVRIVRSDGRRLNLWNCVRRLVGYVISDILFLGYLWVLVDNRRRSWHDHLAGTYVVYSWPEVARLPAAREETRRNRRDQDATESPDVAATQAG